MIFKFQQGGSSLPPFVSYTPVTVTGGAGASSKQEAASSSESSDLTDKDIMKMLEKIDGLPVDMDAISRSLQNFYIDKQYGFNSQGITTQYIKILDELKKANFSKKEYDDAYKVVSENGGLNEYAITDRGQIVCMNSNKQFKLMTVNELKDQQEYTPLTNSELLQMRAYDPKCLNNDSILNVVKSGIGMDAITKMINNTIQSLGTNETSNEGYSEVKQGTVLSGLEAFMQAQQQSDGKYDNTTEDLYKAKLLTKDQAVQARKALDYLYQTLPNNAKTLLKLKSDGTDKGAYDLIGQIVNSKVSQSKNFELDLIAGKTAKQSSKDTGKSSSKDDTDLKTSLELNVMKGIGGYNQSMQVDRGDGVQMSVDGTYYQQIKQPDGSPIVDSSLKDMLANSGLQSIVQNTRNITFGDQKVSMEQLGNITYNNTGLIRAILPKKEDGSVDLDILERWNKLQNQIKLEPDKEKELIEESGLDWLYNSDLSLKQSKLGVFLVTEGYTTGQYFDPKDSEFVKEINNPTDQQIDLIKRSLTIGTGKDKEVPEVDTFDWYNPFDWFGAYDKIYKAAIYIPITNNVNAAVYGADQKLDYDEASIQEQKYRNFNTQTTSAEVL